MKRVKFLDLTKHLYKASYLRNSKRKFAETSSGIPFSE